MKRTNCSRYNCNGFFLRFFFVMLLLLYFCRRVFFALGFVFVYGCLIFSLLLLFCISSGWLHGTEAELAGLMRHFYSRLVCVPCVGIFRRLICWCPRQVSKRHHKCILLKTRRIPDTFVIYLRLNYVKFCLEGIGGVGIEYVRILLTVCWNLI